MFKRSSHRAVVTINQSPIPQNLPLHSSYINNNINNTQTNCYNFPTNNLNESKPQTEPLNSPEDGRINYSNRTQNHGSRHVVNMLGM